MPIHIDDLISRLSNKESLDNIIHSMRSPSEHELAKRCALVRGFDEELVERILRPDIPEDLHCDFNFEMLVNREYVERIPHTRGLYCLNAATRKEYLAGWLKDYERPLRLPIGQPPVPDDMRGLSRSLTDYFETKPEAYQNYELEVLYHLIAAEPLKAESLFEELYSRADKKFDLARCADLVGLLDKRQEILSESLKSVWKEYRGYHSARTRWANEYYQTIYYHQRPDLFKTFREFIFDGSSQWMLNLHSPGGMGKTMFIRWALSRELILKPNRKPFAVIDFDIIDPLRPVAYPWLLLTEIAHQIDVQLPDRPFYELNSDFETFRLFLARKKDSGFGSTTIESGMTESDADSFKERFSSILEDLQFNMPIVVIFDTIEEVMLYQPGGIIDLIQEIEWLHTQYGFTRLLLSGRYPLTHGESVNNDNMDRVPKFHNIYEPETKTLLLKPFSNDDARDYLVNKRNLSHDRPLDVVIRKSGGNPFKLALYADLLRLEPEMDTERIEAYPDADMAYLIDRIVLRISDFQVRWLLRYGCIPRILTRSYLKELMAEPLAREMSNSPIDDPFRDPVQEEMKPHTFRKNIVNPDDPMDLDKLWENLCNYAGKYSWVSVVGGDPDALVFHGDVVNPMRQLLRKYQRDIFDELHAASEKYYELKMETESHDWGRWARELIYHLFQKKDPSADGRYAELMEEALKRGSREWISGLALEVTRKEYEGKTGNVTRAISEFELAWLKIQDIETLPAQEVENALSSIESQFKKAIELKKEILPSGRVVQFQARAAALRSNRDLALELLHQGLADAESYRDRISIKIERAEILLRFEEPHRAIQEYDEILELPEGQLLDAPNLYIAALQGSAKVALSHLKFDRSGEICQRGISVAKRIGDQESENVFTNIFIEAFLRIGPVSGLIGYYNGIGKLSEKKDLDMGTRLAQSRIAMEFFRPDKAAVLCRKALKLKDKNMSREFIPLIVRCQCFLGSVLADLMEFEESLQQFDEARSLAASARDHYRANDAALETARVLIENVGDLRNAGKTLDALEPSDHIQAAKLDLLLTVIEWKKQNQSDIPTSLAFLGYRLLMTGGYKPEEVWSKKASFEELFSLMLNALERVEPVEARLTFLDSIYYESLPLKTRSRILIRIAEVMVPKWVHDINDFPAIEEELKQAIRIIHALRWAGRINEAAAIFNRGLHMSIKSKNMFVLREFLKAGDLLGRTEGIPKGLDYIQDLKPSFKMFQSVLLLEKAERFFGDGQLQYARMYAFKAEGLIQETKLPSQWPARIYGLIASIQNRRAKPDKARNAAQKAIDLFGSLDQPVSPMLSELAETYHRQFKVDAPRDPVISLQIGRWEMGIEAIIPDKHSSPIRVELPLIIEEGEEFSEKYVKQLVSNPYLLMDALSTILDNKNVLNRFESTEPADICLILKDKLLACLPWEINLFEKKTITKYKNLRWIFRGSPKPAITHREKFSSRRRVLIAQASEQRMYENVRGSYDTLEDLRYSYESSGFKTDAIINPSLDSLREGFYEFEPDILHLAATMKQSRHLSGVYLDFTRDTDTYLIKGYKQKSFESDLFTASALSRSLAKNSLSLLILDVSLPPTRIETMRQLLFRNLFAWELFNAGNIRNIFATGLWEEYLQKEIYHRFCDILSEVRPVGDIPRILSKHNLQDRTFKETIAFHGMTLYTVDPASVI